MAPLPAELEVTDAVVVGVINHLTRLLLYVKVIISPLQSITGLLNLLKR